MQKIVHEYTAVKVPVEAKQLIDALYLEAKKLNPRIRKADVWLTAAKSATVNNIVKGK